MTPFHSHRQRQSAGLAHPRQDPNRQRPRGFVRVSAEEPKWQSSAARWLAACLDPLNDCQHGHKALCAVAFVLVMSLFFSVSDSYQGSSNHSLASVSRHSWFVKLLGFSPHAEAECNERDALYPKHIKGGLAIRVTQDSVAFTKHFDKLSPFSPQS